MAIHIQNNEQLDEHGFRVMVLNSLRKNISAFKKEYGRDIIIACDSGISWRNEIFPYYKASRKKNRDESVIDWVEIYKYFHNMRDELAENTNYKVINIPRAEADDIIGHFVVKNGTYLGNETPIVIVSGDRDFVQLHKFSNVIQYDPVHKKRVEKGDPMLYVLEHAIRGDRSDGVPNCLSDDDTFVSGKRQVTMTKKRFDALFEAAKDGTIDVPGYHRNKRLIDIKYTPMEIREAIQTKYDDESSKPKKSMLSYFAKYQVSELLDAISDF